MAERVDKAVRDKAFTYRDQEIRITVSLGIAASGISTPIDDYLEGGVSDELLPMIRVALGNMEKAKKRRVR